MTPSSRERMRSSRTPPRAASASCSFSKLPDTASCHRRLDEKPKRQVASNGKLPSSATCLHTSFSNLPHPEIMPDSANSTNKLLRMSY
jgi:hypothetical protein